MLMSAACLEARQEPCAGENMERAETKLELPMMTLHEEADVMQLLDHAGLSVRPRPRARLHRPAHLYA